MPLTQLVLLLCRIFLELTMELPACCGVEFDSMLTHGQATEIVASVVCICILPWFIPQATLWCLGNEQNVLLKGKAIK